MPLDMVLSAPERDLLAALWRLDPDVRACLCAAAILGVLLLGVKGYFAALVYAAALAPGLLFVRTAVRRHPGAAADGALARSALAGLLGTLIILEYEHVVHFCGLLITKTASAGNEASGVAATVWLAFAEVRKRGRGRHVPRLRSASAAALAAPWRCSTRRARAARWPPVVTRKGQQAPTILPLRSRGRPAHCPNAGVLRCRVM